MQEIKQKLIAAVVGIAVGIGVGGLIWGSGPEKVEVEKLVQSSITKVEFREVKIREVITAAEAHVTEVRHTDGTITLDSHFYGLGIDKQTQVAESSTSMETSVEREKTTATAKPKWVVSAGFFTSPVDPLAFDYRRDWQASIGRRVGDSPFFISAFGGPRLIGLGLAAEF